MRYVKSPYPLKWRQRDHTINSRERRELKERVKDTKMGYYNFSENIE
jgi:hypothetical protein